MARSGNRSPWRRVKNEERTAVVACGTFRDRGSLMASGLGLGFRVTRMSNHFVEAATRVYTAHHFWASKSGPSLFLGSPPSNLICLSQNEGEDLFNVSTFRDRGSLMASHSVTMLGCLILFMTDTSRLRLLSRCSLRLPFRGLVITLVGGQPTQ